MNNSLLHEPVELIAIDMDGTLLGSEGKVSARNLAALQAAERTGIHVVVATGRRHCYAMRHLRELGLNAEGAVISSNGAVTRTLGEGFAGSRLLDRTLLPSETARWLCRQVGEFRNALVITFDRVGEDGEDARGALVVEELAELNASIGRWLLANQPYIEHVVPIEDALGREGLIQMMLCGTIERMRRAESRLLEDPRVSATSVALESTRSEMSDVEQARRVDDGSGMTGEVALHRTEYPERDLCILDILPAGCSKGDAISKIAGRHGVKLGNCMAIGDNWNDVSMLAAVGHPVLMANAPDDLKLLAAECGWTIAPHHLEDGVGEASEGVLQAPGVRRGMASSGRL